MAYVFRGQDQTLIPIMLLVNSLILVLYLATDWRL